MVEVDGMEDGVFPLVECGVESGEDLSSWFSSGNTVVWYSGK